MNGPRGISAQFGWRAWAARRTRDAKGSRRPRAGGRTDGRTDGRRRGGEAARRRGGEVEWSERRRRRKEGASERASGQKQVRSKILKRERGEERRGEGREREIAYSERASEVADTLVRPADRPIDRDRVYYVVYSHTRSHELRRWVACRLNSISDLELQSSLNV